MATLCDREIDRNYNFFVECVANLVPQHLGKFALLRDAKIVHMYISAGEAIFAGHNKFQDGVFSIQEVTDRPLDLGFFSHANTEGGVRTNATDS